MDWVSQGAEVEGQHLCPGISQEAALTQVIFERGQGCYLTDTEGVQYLDMAAGIFTQNVGHQHPYVVERLKQQLDKLCNVHDSATPARAELCAKLAEKMPADLSVFAFFSSGAEAIEAALRAVFQFAEPHRQKVAALRYGFHGKTQGARSLVHWDVGYQNQCGQSVLGYGANCYRCPLGRTYPACDIQCAQLVNQHISSKSNIAALFFEPVQGAAGVIVPPKEYWQQISQVCKENGVLLVADEVVSAGGRTGYFLASEYYEIEPDLLVAAKGLSSGVPFSLLAGREGIMSRGSFAEAGSTSSTYGGNPLSCTAASATLDVLTQQQVVEDVAAKGQLLGQGLQELATDFDCIGDVRGIGLLWAIEFVSCKQAKTPAPEIAQRFFRIAMEKGLRTCFGGHIVRLGPPLTISTAELKEALALITASLQELNL